MTKRKSSVLIVGLVLGFVLSLCMATTFTYTLDTTRPQGTEAPSVLDNFIRDDKIAWGERLNVDHIFALTASQFSDPDTGYHKDIHFFSSTATDPILGVTAVDGVDELRYTNSDGSTFVLSDAGTLNVTSASLLGALANNTYFSAVDNAGTGTVDLIKANASDVAVLPDGSELASSGAPTADADIANKKYVDDSSVLVQTVYTQSTSLVTCTTAIPLDNTIPQSDEGNEVMTRSITPTSASNILKITVNCFLNSGPAVFSTIALFQDSGANAIAVGTSRGDSAFNSASFTFLMTAGTTSSTTFKVRAGDNGGTATFNSGTFYGGKATSTLIIEEIKP